MSDRISNVLATISTWLSAGGAATSITLAQVNEVVSIAAGVVAIISGICAARYYIKKSHELNRDVDRGNK